MFSVANNQYEPISVNDEARTSLNWANVAEEVKSFEDCLIQTMVDKTRGNHKAGGM